MLFRRKIEATYLLREEDKWDKDMRGWEKKKKKKKIGKHIKRYVMSTFVLGGYFGV
jgi:hypothetical protein